MTSSYCTINFTDGKKFQVPGDVADVLDHLSTGQPLAVVVDSSDRRIALNPVQITYIEEYAG